MGECKGMGGVRRKGVNVLRLFASQIPEKKLIWFFAD
jgi:hypothetical protein